MKPEDSVDEEEGERFLKALTPCRHCGHVKLAHSLIQKRCVDARLIATGRYKLCKCNNFEPKDNLEFLEYKYEKKLGKKK
jgi:hypothetical protein